MKRVLLCLCLLLTRVAAAQPALESVATELEATERRASDKAAPAKEREQAADKAIELRKRLITGVAADDPRLPGLLIAQAAGQLARLGRDGADTAVLFGIPLPAQGESTKQAAEEAVQLLARASAILEQRSKALTDVSTPPDDPKLVQIEQDRTVRAPFFAARARVLLAAGTTGKERKTHAQAAFDAIGKLSLSSPGPEGIRRISLGAALMMKSDPPEAADLQTAVDEFGWVLTGGAGNQAATGIPGGTRAEAWFGLVQAAGGLDKLQPVLDQLRPALAKDPFVGADGRPEALLHVLAADAVARSWLEMGLRTKDRGHLQRAADAEVALLSRQDLGFRPESLRPLVFQKLSLMAERAGSSVDLPPAMDLALAIDAAKDPKRRDEAIKRLQAVSGAADGGDYAADAMWELAVLLTQGSPAAADRLLAATSLTKLARQFPGNPRSREAMSAALSYAQALSREDGPLKPRGEEAYAAALAVATSGYPTLPNIDTWRYEHARVIADGTDADRQTALRVLREVAPASSIGSDALKLWERIQAGVLDQQRERVRESRASGADVQKLCREQYLPESRGAVEFARARGSVLLDRFRADFADAMTETGDVAGRAIYDHLIKRRADAPGGTARLRLGLARSMMLGGDAPGAFVILRDLVTSLDAAPSGSPASARPEAFWFAWTLMLEELAVKNADGSRSGTMKANIRRLESIDAGLGGEPWKSRITAVAAKLKG